MHWDVDCVGIVDLTLKGNKIWDWGGPMWVMGGGVHPGGTGNLSMQRLNGVVVNTVSSTDLNGRLTADNLFQSSATSPNLRVFLADPVRRVTAGGERIETLVQQCFDRMNAGIH